MKKLLLMCLAVVAGMGIVRAQEPAAQDVAAQEPEIGTAEWNVSVAAVEEGVFEVTFEATITEGWHMYDLGPYEMPMETLFDFAASTGLETVDGPYQFGEPHRYFDELFGFELAYYEGTARFAQKVRATGAEAVLAGEVAYQICKDEFGCVGGSWEFSVPVKEGATVTSADEASANGGSGAAGAENDGATISSDDDFAGDSSRGLWGMILEAILWGFAALLTPCVFPMAPMTVSFFMKGGENKALARLRAIMFGVFIVLLYTLPIAVIIIVTRVAGGAAVTADIFNWLATAWVPNVLFFLVFMVFAASLLGAFEIRMPSKMVNRSDAGAEKKGLVGIFFLALTLVLVSFSCTGPIVGTVLIKSTQGEFWAPIVTMLAFSVAFALPFTLLAFFPGLMNRLPKSGGWLNSVKVILGLVEIALGLKFLSVADQTYHWGILDREIYLAIWIVVFSLLGLYLLGKIRFKHDSPTEHIGVGRLGLAIVVFSFVVYLIPGMWGAPLKGLSGYMPPMSTQDFVAGSGSGVAATAASDAPASRDIKYSDILHLPHGMTGYFDLEQGMEAARAADKPVFLDFTGHGCVNCREMEARVWVDGEVQRILREDYVVIALYSDDRTSLPEEEWLTTPEGKTMKTIGRKNSYIINTRYGVSAQPAYMLLDPANGELLAPVYGYNLDVSDFVEFLNNGK
ncbi:MAG: thioredoxin family protein [Alistipes sp.]|jgi:thiol:disulfide interchange protein DsbD|nr:thioredoxin family protein [Alistipes sp.]